MSSISGLNGGTDYSSLFSSLSAGSGTNGANNNLLSDWASLKNGSYGKLTKAYYGKHAAQAVSDEAKETIKANTSLKSDATDIRSAVSKLQSASLYEKKTTTDADGNEKTDYDYDKIVGALKDFAEKYNSVIDAADDSDNRGVLRNAVAMTRATATNQNLLSKIGITVDENNKLKVDEEQVKKASVNDIKTLFQGGGSYGSQVESSASEMANKLNAENNKLSSYTANGSYSQSGAIGNIYDGTY